jgi:hypothetical protein
MLLLSLANGDDAFECVWFQSCHPSRFCFCEIMEGE